MPSSTALDRAPKYFGEFLSENIIETPSGYRICKNVVIARTGFQTYRVREIDDPQGLLSNYNADDEIELWRDPDEVFSVATIASFEGMPVTLQHPEEMLDLENTAESKRGHAQNVRKGKEPLEDGNLPLLADLFIDHPEAVQAIDNGVREVSCGYYYTLAKTGERFDQTNLRGNHIAIVQKARAGDEARINDSAPEPALPPTKEKPVSFLKTLLGLGMKEYAKDAKPEEIAEAVEGIQKETASKTATNGNGHKRHRSTGNDAESDSPSASVSDDASRSASASASAEPSQDEKPIQIKLTKAEWNQLPAKEKQRLIGSLSKEDRRKLGINTEGNVSKEDIRKIEGADDDVLKHPETAAPKSAFDAAHRQRLHDALDKVIDEKAEEKSRDEKEEEPTLDAEMEELKDLFGEEEDASASPSASAEDQSSSSEEIPAQLSGSDSAEPPEAEDEEEETEDEEEETEDAGEEAEVIGEEDAEEEEAEDAEKPIVREEPVLKEGDRQKKAFDSVGLTRKTLRRLKPFIARAKDKQLQKAFDIAYRGVRKMEDRAKDHRGSYAKVREVTRHSVAEDADKKSPAEEAAASYESSMKQRMDKESERFKTLTARR